MSALAPSQSSQSLSTLVDALFVPLQPTSSTLSTASLSTLVPPPRQTPRRRTSPAQPFAAETYYPPAAAQRTCRTGIGGYGNISRRSTKQQTAACARSHSPRSRPPLRLAFRQTLAALRARYRASSSYPVSIRSHQQSAPVSPAPQNKLVAQDPSHSLQGDPHSREHSPVTNDNLPGAGLRLAPQWAIGTAASTQEAAQVFVNSSGSNNNLLSDLGSSFSLKHKPTAPKLVSRLKSYLKLTNPIIN